MNDKEKRPKPSLIQRITASLLLLFMIFTLIGATVGGITNLPIKEVEKAEVAVEEETNTITAATEVEETYTEFYTTTDLNIRKGPSTDYDIVKTVSVNTKLKTVDNSKQGEWIKIKDNNKDYYVNSKYLSKTKTKIEVAQVTSRSTNETRPKSSTTGAAAGHLTKSGGVYYYNGHKETWYSQRVLPGGGLKIPGRHVASDGTIRDENNYICVASSDYKKGTIVETSLGTGKVYDCGCASGTIDIYTDW